MKPIVRIGTWKAIAFLAAVISLVACQNELPPTVETVSTKVKENGTTIDVYGKVISDGGDDIYQKGFCLSRHALPTISDEVKEGGRIGKSLINFAGCYYDLDQNATYYVRAYAQNAVGIGYGEVIEVYTSTLALAQTGAAADLTTSEATLKATVDPLNSEVETWFEVWRSGEQVQRVEIQKTGAKSATEIFARATGLTPGEVYSYAVKVRNAYGIATGETKTFRLYYEQVTDSEGNKYYSVKIGNQIWLAENLKTTKFANGDPIPNVQPDAEWIAMKSPAYCYTKNDPELGKVYGALYNNYVGLDQRGLIAGYHTPSIQEYRTLVSFLGGGTIAAKKLKSATDDWYDNGKGDNSSGFNALPGGRRRDDNDAFKSFKAQASFLTTTPMEEVGAYYDANVYYNSDYVMTAGANPMYFGRSIRLIKN